MRMRGSSAIRRSSEQRECSCCSTPAALSHGQAEIGPALTVVVYVRYQGVKLIAPVSQLILDQMICMTQPKSQEEAGHLICKLLNRRMQWSITAIHCSTPSPSELGCHCCLSPTLLCRLSGEREEAVLICDALKHAEMSGAQHIGRAALRPQDGVTVSQSFCTRPPVSPELAFQSHQNMLGMLAWGKLAAE